MADRPSTYGDAGGQNVPSYPSAPPGYSPTSGQPYMAGPAGAITHQPGQTYHIPGGQGQPGQPHHAGAYYNPAVVQGQPGQPYNPAGVYLQPPGGMPMPGQEPAWMEKPIVENCPPGLEYLTLIDQLVVKQQVELLEVITGFETENKYRIFNNLGQQVYYAREESDCCQRQCCGPGRGFVIHITDNSNQEVMKIVREFKCCAGCGWCACSDCCAFLVSVQDRSGNVLGYVRQSQSCWKPQFTVRTPDFEVGGNITGPCCVCSSPCCGDVEFPVTSTDGSTEIGKVSKQWTGWVKEMFTDADTFSISFPMDMDVGMKATFMGALFLIDFMYFETKQDNNK